MSRLNSILKPNADTEQSAPEVPASVDMTTFTTVVRHLLDVQKSQEEALFLLADVVSQPIRLSDKPVETINQTTAGLSPATKSFAMGINARNLARKRISDLLDTLNDK